MKKVKIYTLGCKVNQYESQAMEDMLLKEGFAVAAKGESVDLCVINTCTVTGVSDKKSRQIIRRAKRANPHAIIAVTGCLTQVSPEEVKKMAEVDIVLGAANKGEIISAVKKAMEQREKVVSVPAQSKNFEPLFIDNFSERTRAFIKIQDGCDRFCSYCIIPYARGPVRSRDGKEICEEIKGLCKKGFCEFVLTGIHVASYGRNTDYKLTDLLRDVDKIDGVKRIRMSSVDPMAFTDEFIEEISGLKNLCPHFHLSLQSGADKILGLMNRKYSAKMYAQVVAKIRSAIKDAAITTDIITGFPGEGEEEFLETVNFAKQVNLNGIHVFPYSERKGTKAAELDGKVPVHVREDRARRLIEVAAELRNEFVSGYVGREVEVLWEQKTKDGRMCGFTKNYIKVYAKDGQSGEMTKVIPAKAENGELTV